MWVLMASQYPFRLSLLAAILEVMELLLVFLAEMKACVTNDVESSFAGLDEVSELLEGAAVAVGVVKQVGSAGFHDPAAVASNVAELAEQYGL